MRVGVLPYYLLPEQVYLQEVEQRFSPWVWAEWSNSEEYRSSPWALNSSLAGPYDSVERNLDLWRSIKQTVQRDQVCARTAPPALISHTTLISPRGAGEHAALPQAAIRGDCDDQRNATKMPHHRRPLGATPNDCCAVPHTTLAGSAAG